MIIIDRVDMSVAPSAHPSEVTPAVDLRPDGGGLGAAVAKPAAFAVDLGSAFTRIWAAGRPILHTPSTSQGPTDTSGFVRRGRIIDAEGAQGILAHLLHSYYRSPVLAGGVLVACRPVLCAPDEERTIRRLLRAVFAPARMIFIPSVRAAAIGAGEPPGPLLVADVGAQLTEVAVLAGGGVAAARRAEVGMSDLTAPTAIDPVVEAIVGLVDELRHHPHSRGLVPTAGRSPLLLVGGGGAHPLLGDHTADALGIAVRRTARPCLAAVRGAALAARATLRRIEAIGR